MGSLGWPEILIILVIALIIFGPRKLPELGKTLGASLAQFRRASEDFKRTWEEEVELEKRKLDAPPPETVDYSSSTEPYEGQDFSLEGTPSFMKDGESGEGEGSDDENTASSSTDELTPVEAFDQSAIASAEESQSAVEGAHAPETGHDVGMKEPAS